MRSRSGSEGRLLESDEVSGCPFSRTGVCLLTPDVGGESSEVRAIVLCW